MRNLVIACLSITSLAACGKKPPEPAQTTATAPMGEAAATADATLVTAPDASPDIAVPAEVVVEDEVLVWSVADKGYTTAWLASDGSEVASRPEAVIADANDLWAIQWRWSAFEEIPCDFEDEVPSTPRGQKKHYPWLVAKSLGTTKPDNVLLPEYKGDLGAEAEAGALPTYIGEHWGKNIELTGSYDGLLFLSWCDGGYGCGAHGNTDCAFDMFSFGREAMIDLTEIDKELASTTKAAHDKWRADMAEDGELTIGLSEIKVRSGDPIAVDYLFTADVSYAATDGNWSSYTQGLPHAGPPAKAMHMPGAPPALTKWLAAQPKGKVFGWSVIPTSRRSSLDAFKDLTTLAPPKPEAGPFRLSNDKRELSADSMLTNARKATKERRYSDALRDFDRLIADAPTVARAWSGRGYAKLLSDDLAGAKSDFDKALTLDVTPKFQGAVYFNLGELALRQKDPAAAKAAFAKADSLAPSPAAKKQLERLK